ncbi:hypothetical protein Acr_05g0009400 [Actinidia rufa]|uniref:Uncharacterized protein n=1 Tax=Actinidia rufa TaxID=165716 RepID=A0A7J0DQE9_9ERIC|nr:hypothetical protein Acr_00g0062520 [Actinidia rufa]GFY87301.1 hypothetical protein Acr_05g0009400 [Actinidia rufa]
MIRMQNGVEADDCDSDGQVVEENADSDEYCVVGEGIYRKLGSLKTCPFEMGDLQVISLVYHALQPCDDQAIVVGYCG